MTVARFELGLARCQKPGENLRSLSRGLVRQLNWTIPVVPLGPGAGNLDLRPESGHLPGIWSFNPRSGHLPGIWSFNPEYGPGTLNPDLGEPGPVPGPIYTPLPVPPLTRPVPILTHTRHGPILHPSRSCRSVRHRSLGPVAPWHIRKCQNPRVPWPIRLLIPEGVRPGQSSGPRCHSPQ